MKNAYAAMRVGIYSYPRTLSLLPKKQQDIVNNLFPVDTGFEIECNTIYNVYNSQINTKLEELGVKHTECDSSEKRFRIPAGIEGLVILFNVLEYLKTVCHPNPASGIHYHIDCTDLDWHHSCWRHNNTQGILVQYNENVHCFDKILLDPLKSWGYKGYYNHWSVNTMKTAVRLHSDYKTVEFRIGEHTLDYNLIVHRVIHCQSLVKHLKIYLKSL